MYNAITIDVDPITIKVDAVKIKNNTIKLSMNNVSYNPPSFNIGIFDKLAIAGINVSTITYTHALPYTCTREYRKIGLYSKPNEIRNNMMDEFCRLLEEKNVPHDRPYYKINLWYMGYHIQVSNEYVTFHNIDCHEVNDVTNGIEEILEFKFDVIRYDCFKMICSVDYREHYNLGLLRRLLSEGFLFKEIGWIYRVNYNTFCIDCFCQVVMKGRNCLVFKGKYSDINDIVKGYQLLYMMVILPHILLLGRHRSNMRVLVLDVIGIIIGFLRDLYDDSLLEDKKVYYL